MADYSWDFPVGGDSTTTNNNAAAAESSSSSNNNSSNSTSPQQEAGSAGSTPAKRGRGRPRKVVDPNAPPKEELRYRCRYGCIRAEKNQAGMRAQDLRKHMARMHGIFSSNHAPSEVLECMCGRRFVKDNKNLSCANNAKNGNICRTMTQNEIAQQRVQWPRDEQEAADTFAYEHAGASELVIVRPHHNEGERIRACLLAIEQWQPASARAEHAASVAASLTAAPSSGETAQPWSPSQGKGKKRAADADFEEPAPKHQRQDSGNFLAPTAAALSGPSTSGAVLAAESNSALQIPEEVTLIAGAGIGDLGLNVDNGVQGDWMDDAWGLNPGVTVDGAAAGGSSFDAAAFGGEFEQAHLQTPEGASLSAGTGIGDFCLNIDNGALGEWMGDTFGLDPGVTVDGAAAGGSSSDPAALGREIADYVAWQARQPEGTRIDWSQMPQPDFDWRC